MATSHPDRSDDGLPPATNKSVLKQYDHVFISLLKVAPGITADDLLVAGRCCSSSDVRDDPPFFVTL